MIYNWQKLKLKSCDQILCSGSGRLSKQIIWFNKLTGVKGLAAELSHVAMVYYNGLGGLHWVFESTTINKFSNQKGVQTNRFDEWLKNYKGRVWVRKLDFKRTSNFDTRYIKFVADNIGKPYESGIPGMLELFLAGARISKFIRWFWKSYRPLATKEIHCSENNINATQYLNLCDKNAIPNRLPPNCFWENGKVDGYLLVPISEPLQIK